MTLRLSDDETEALRAYAEQQGISMQEAARDAVRRLIRGEARVTSPSSRILIGARPRPADRLAQ